MPSDVIDAADLMHATRWPHALTADAWVFENELDGFRALVRKQGSSIELISRNGRPMTEQFPDVAQALCDLPSCVLDGELVVVESSGHAAWDRVRTRAVMRQPWSDLASSA